MGYHGPQDPGLRDAWRSARRESALRSHPDRGGDGARMAAELAEIDRQFAFAESAAGSLADRALWHLPVWRVARRARRQTGRAVRVARSRIPRRWPGSRRYVDL